MPASSHKARGGEEETYHKSPEEGDFIVLQLDHVEETKNNHLANLFKGPDASSCVEGGARAQPPIARRKHRSRFLCFHDVGAEVAVTPLGAKWSAAASVLSCAVSRGCKEPRLPPPLPWAVPALIASPCIHASSSSPTGWCILLRSVYGSVHGTLLAMLAMLGHAAMHHRHLLRLLLRVVGCEGIAPARQRKMDDPVHGLHQLQLYAELFGIVTKGRDQ